MQPQLKGRIDSIIDPSMKLGSTEAAKRAVQAGLGISLVLASIVSDEISSGRLCALSLGKRKLKKDLLAINGENPLGNSAALRFRKFLLGEP
jgi:DNA-binding transcriptional LysR family regulator